MISPGKCRNQNRPRRRGRRLPRSLSFILLPCFLLAAEVEAQPVCDASRLEQAGSLYEFGWFDDAFSLLRPCVPDGFPEKAQRVDAYGLMARFYIATDSLEYARLWIEQLLREEPRYRPDPRLEGFLFTDMVQELRPRWYSWLWRGNAWYQWVGRGVLVSGVASIPFLLRGDEEPDLPEPPLDPVN